MEKVKDFLKILVCPDCQRSLRRLDSFFFCPKCKTKFPVHFGIPVLLPKDFQKNQDFSFKKAQIEFFDNWSSSERGTKKPESGFEKFFSSKVGYKKINYSEKAIASTIERLPKNSYVLELGCGAGEHTAFMAKLRDDINFVAIDISLKSVLETKKRIKGQKIKSKINFLVADAEKLPFKHNIFSAILAVMFFHHLGSVKESLKEAKRTLSSQGVCLLVDFSANNPLVTIPRKIFPLFPSFLKRKFQNDYLLEDKIPQVRIRRLEEFKNEIINLNLKIIREEKHELFVFGLYPLGTIFPFLKRMLSENILNLFYNLEGKLLKNRFISRFAGAFVLWISH
jgi:ubiquinone/menaquinone biosynthesis C-methylase UbiE/uncharacterized protein YbaR (Trm112 family)